VSASPLGSGALTCLWRPPFLAQYLATVSLPLLAAAGVIAIFLSVTALRSARVDRLARTCRLDTASVRTAVLAWMAERRHVSTLMVGAGKRG